jgi:asparagine synthase (glutamine-hydrolysing)
MCGFFAYHSPDRPAEPHEAARALERLRHRGPDGRNVWTSPDARVVLGHARLSIIDLEGGAQPLSNEDGSCRAVVTGEFYGFEAIRRDLEGRGHAFRTGSDSEILLHLYEEYGVDCFTHLRGEFAFVLWDAGRRRLFAGRDRFGVKPLFYALRGGTLRLASEAKALFAAGVEAAWDEETYLQHLFVCRSPDRTLFAGVYQLPPGHYLLAEGDALAVREYWDLDYPADDDPGLYQSEGEAAEAVRAALEDAVRVRLRADVPVGTYLSGGVDSSAVHGVAARLAGGDVRAFTVAFGVEGYDEGPIAEETCRATKTTYHPITLDQADFADAISDAVFHAESVGVNANAMARLLQGKAVRDAGYKVVLSGDGGDELFAGYHYFRYDALRAAPERAGGLEAIEARRSTNAPTRAELAKLPSFDIPAAARGLEGFTPAWLQLLGASRSRLGLVLGERARSLLETSDPFGRLLGAYPLERLRGRHPVIKALYLWNKTILPNQVLFSERLDMGHSVEVRLPLLDHRLFEVARKIPARLLIDENLVEKRVLHEAARPYLTDAVYGRPKMPFIAPESTMVPGSKLFELVQDTLRGPRLASSPFFEQSSLLAILDNVQHASQTEKIAYDGLFLLAVSTALLEERLIAGAAA